MTLEDIEFVLRRSAESIGLSAEQVKAALQELKLAAAEAKEAREADAAKKPAMVPLLFALGDLPGLDEIPFFVVEMSDEIPHTEAVARFTAAVAEHNQTLLGRRGKKRKTFKSNPISTLAEAMEFLPRTALTPHGIRARHKVPAICIPTSDILKLPAPEPEPES